MWWECGLIEEGEGEYGLNNLKGNNEDGKWTNREEVEFKWGGLGDQIHSQTRL